MKRLLHIVLAAAALFAGPVAITACTADPPADQAPVVPAVVELESTRALALANEAYLGANLIATKAIEAGLIKGETMQAIGRLDLQINALLDKASTARDAVEKASAIRNATDLILEFRNIVAPFKGIIYGSTSDSDPAADHRRHAAVPADPGAGQQRARYSG
jgi:multidrug resistance efflux pump